MAARLPPRRPGCTCKPLYVGFVVNKGTLGQVFSKYFSQSVPCQCNSTRASYAFFHVPSTLYRRICTKELTAPVSEFCVVQSFQRFRILCYTVLSAFQNFVLYSPFSVSESYFIVVLLVQTPSLLYSLYS